MSKKILKKSKNNELCMSKDGKNRKMAKKCCRSRKIAKYCGKRSTMAIHGEKLKKIWKHYNY